MSFDSIIGQEIVVKSLKNSISANKTGHAYIFTGPSGIGKKTVARAFAGALLCEKPHGGEACGGCTPCRLYNKGTNPDFYRLQAEESSIGVEAIRDLQADVIIKPMYSQRKVYLIAGADDMTAQAQNCLLKTLEEPPGYAVFILTASNYDALLETVRSRAVKHSFRKNSFDEIFRLLESRRGGAPANAAFIAAFSDGIVGDALKMAESAGFNSLREQTLETVLKLSKGKLYDVFASYRFFEDNRQDIGAVLNMMLSFYRDMLVLKEGGPQNMLINSDKKDIILNNASGFGVRKLFCCIEAVEAARRNIKTNANFQLAVEVMLMKLQEERI